MRNLIASLLAVLALCLVVAFPVVAEGLRKYERSVHSQFGEDGVIEKIFEIIPPTQKFAVEFGAGDGVRDSNVRNLIVNKGWGALMIEGNSVYARNMKKTYKNVERAKAVEAWVFPGNIETLFEENGVPKDLDLLVIDIDSNDYWVWKAIHNYRPKVVFMEANPAFAPPQLMVIQFHPMNYWDGSNYYGASAQSIYRLAKQKGYELVHHVSAGNNLVFVDAPYYERFGIADNSPEKLYTPSHVAEKRDDAPNFLPVGGMTIPKKILTDR